MSLSQAGLPFGHCNVVSSTFVLLGKDFWQLSRSLFLTKNTLNMTDLSALISNLGLATLSPHKIRGNFQARFLKSSLLSAFPTPPLLHALRAPPHPAGCPEKGYSTWTTAAPVVCPLPLHTRYSSGELCKCGLSQASQEACLPHRHPVLTFTAQRKCKWDRACPVSSQARGVQNAGREQRLS